MREERDLSFSLPSPLHTSVVGHFRPDRGQYGIRHKVYHHGHSIYLQCPKLDVSALLQHLRYSMANFRNEYKKLLSFYQRRRRRRMSLRAKRRRGGGGGLVRGVEADIEARAATASI